jgi:hypothetical protein
MKSNSMLFLRATPKQNKNKKFLWRGKLIVNILRSTTRHTVAENYHVTDKTNIKVLAGLTLLRIKCITEHVNS